MGERSSGRVIERTTADAGDYRVKVQEIDGLLPFSLVVKQITLSGPDGEWLTARGIDFSLKISSLLAGVLDVQWFRMESVALSRLPVSEEKKPSAEPPKKRRLSIPPPHHHSGGGNQTDRTVQGSCRGTHGL